MKAVWFLLLLMLAMASLPAMAQQQPIGVNWGTQLSHPLPPESIVQMLVANHVARVKLFDADPSVMRALAGSGLEVMVGIPNDMLATLSSLAGAADWVRSNVTAFVSGRKPVNIRYVAVGNEPFLSAYNGSFQTLTLPALKNVQQALSSAGLAGKVAVTVPLNADVLSHTAKPSTAVFRDDIAGLTLSIVQFLNQSGGPFTLNLYPFLSLHQDPNFPRNFAFFDGNAAPLVDGQLSYSNVFEAMYDSLVVALTAAGFPSMPIIVGEVGWPTDGDPNANTRNAQLFNQGLLRHVLSSTGTPRRPGSPLHVYLFSLIDEDRKSIRPGNFEPHWGIFTYDGQPKYGLDMSGHGDPSAQLQKVQGVRYQEARWCILKPSKQVPPDSVSYACAKADCTALTYGGSCNSLDSAGNASYAFNSYYQATDQLATSCDFQGNAIVTNKDPSTGNCRFIRQIVPLTGPDASACAFHLLSPLLLSPFLVLVWL